jgi:spore maturation protein CgeB
MNILYYWPEQDRYMDKWQRIHIFDELEENGHTIEVFNPLAYKNFSIANEEFIKSFRIRKKLPDLFMTCVGSEQIFSETIETVRSKSVPTLLICFDNLHAPFMHQKIAPQFDLVWLTSRETQYLFKKWGCNTLFMPYAANPNRFHINYSGEIDAIGFIGTPYGTRTSKINQLTKNNITCHVYTNVVNSEDQSIADYKQLLNSFFYLSRFKIGRNVIWGAIKNKIGNKSDNLLVRNDYLNLFPSVSFSEMNKLYSNLALSLGITELRNTYALKNPVHKIHLRTFEIPMCGGLQLTSYTPELENYFKNDKEIILYKNSDEMISKATFYLQPKNEKLRKKMKFAARERAEREHTWLNRFNKVFKYLNL